MPDLVPFRGVRYSDAADLDAVIAPPYDVIDERDREALERRDPHNAVRLILPRATDDADPYEAAARTLVQWRTEGILVPDDRPAFYAYSRSTPAE